MRPLNLYRRGIYVISVAVMSSFAIISFVFLSIMNGISTDKELLEVINLGRVEEAERLIRSGLRGEDFEERNRDGETSLLVALYAKYENLALLLIKSGANVNAVTKVGNHRIINRSAPLHVAVWSRLTSCVSALIAAGAYVNKKDYDGRTPLMILAQDSSGLYNADVARILLHAGADINEPVYSHIELAQPLRPLHYAARNYNAPVAELLISKGANVNEMGGVSYPQAPIDYVMIYNDEFWGPSGKAMDTAIILLNNGADQTESNDFPKILKAFWTPAHFKLEPGAREDFDDFLLRITATLAAVSKLVKRNAETFSLMDYVRNEFLKIGMFFNYKYSITRKIIESAREFDQQGTFALYRLLKTFYDAYGHGTRNSVLEDVKLDIFDYVSNEISKLTYFEKMPIDLMADVLYEAGYYGWKIERLACNVALAVYHYRSNVDAKHLGGEIAHILLLESEKDL